MIRAALFAGNGAIQFLDEILDLAKFFEDRQEVRLTITPAAENFIQPGYFMARLEEALRTSSSDPLLVAYAGHGCNFGWGPGAGVGTAPYYWISDLLTERRATPTLVINETCSAFSLKQFFEADLPVKNDQRSVIAAAQHKAFSYGGMIRSILRQWREGLPYDPKRERENKISTTPTHRSNDDGIAGDR